VFEYELVLQIYKHRIPTNDKCG